MKHIRSLCRDFYRYTHRHKSSRNIERYHRESPKKVEEETSIVTKRKNERERERESVCMCEEDGEDLRVQFSFLWLRLERTDGENE